MTTLYAATTNPGKLREFAQAAAPAHVRVLPLPGLKDLREPVEDAPDFAGNAALKAIAYSRSAPGHLVFADDSGLEVDALQGRPGVLSARFAESCGFELDRALHNSVSLPPSKDDRNNRCLLAQIHEREAAVGGRIARSARFVCALALARDGDVLLRAEGTVDGEILDAPQGANGFGYDPLFAIGDRGGLTLAQLSPADKWAISHRGKAFRSLLLQLQTSAFQPV